ncbi:TPA: 2'-5' RNA ligase family protein [Candidatus Poribacteria bacterium]|nr:2'-5' RNA ligase family protein [Candidatus Poribacteria bacterium]
MHHKTYQTAVVIIPPKEIWTSIQSIRRQHDANYRRWMPHITLIYPFRPRSEFEVVADQLAAICQTQSPFSVCLKPFGYFSHHRSRYTIWLDPKSPSGVSDKILCRPNPIVDLQTELWQTVPDCNDTRRFKNGFTPHLSVGQATGKSELDYLLCQFQQEWKPLTFSVSEVQLIWRNAPPNDIFQVDKTITFS